MIITETEFADLCLFTPQVHYDRRGYFLETAQHRQLSSYLPYPLVQDNESYSQMGVLRGLHYQTGTHAQGKLVRVAQGRIFTVALDLRAEQPTFGKHFSVVLDDERKQQLWIPRGFAHGHLVLSASALVLYRCDNYYHPASERGLRWNDPSLAINWPMPSQLIQTSDKDACWPLQVLA